MADNNNPDAKSDLIKEGFNIWQEILDESTTKKDNEEANIFVFGDKFTGKKSLIRIMNREMASQDYDYKKSVALFNVRNNINRDIFRISYYDNIFN